MGESKRVVSQTRLLLPLATVGTVLLTALVLLCAHYENDRISRRAGLRERPGGIG